MPPFTVPSKNDGEEEEEEEEDEEEEEEEQAWAGQLVYFSWAKFLVTVQRARSVSDTPLFSLTSPPQHTLLPLPHWSHFSLSLPCHEGVGGQRPIPENLTGRCGSVGFNSTVKR